MNIEAIRRQLNEQYPFFDDLPDTVFNEIEHNALLVNLEKGQTVFWEGDKCRNFSLLLSGTVRVFKVGESGHEITLYRFHQGGGCILTASSILNNSTFPAIARVDEKAEALIIPAVLVKEWIGKYEQWRNFICGLLASRLSDVITTVEEIAFKRMDIRIAEYLMKAFENNKIFLAVTHQQIADELGTAREVVSRILKDYEIEGIIKLQRGKIELLDLKKIEKMLEL